jgi:hypothetical protein
MLPIGSVGIVISVTRYSASERPDLATVKGAALNRRPDHTENRGAKRDA